MDRHVVARADEIGPGERRLVHVGGRAIVLFNVDGEFFAILNRCPHQGGSLCEGRLTGLVTSTEPGRYEYSQRGAVIRCPWHAWEFDVRTGQSWCEPGRIRVRSFKAEVQSGAGLVEGPYVAETFPVTRDGDYVVIEA